MNKILLPPGFCSRPAGKADLPELVTMFNIDARRVVGVEKFTVEAYGHEWETPGFDLERDTCLVLAPDGSIAGYYDFWDLDEPHVIYNCWGRVHPDQLGKGIGSYLLNWAESRACLSIPAAPPQARISLTSFVIRMNEAAKELFLGSGFQAVRYSLRMVIDLQEQPPEPVWPEGIRVRSLRVGQDEPAVVQAVRDSFRDHWGYVERPFEDDLSRWKFFIETDPDLDPSLWLLAVNGGPGEAEKVVAICLCHPKISDDHEMGWVGTLGVTRPYRKQGLGLALLQYAFGEFYRRGKPRAGLGVDAESLTGATRLYLKAGMRPDPQREYVNYEKVLRPGKDLRTQAIGD